MKTNLFEYFSMYQQGILGPGRLADIRLILGYSISLIIGIACWTLGLIYRSERTADLLLFLAALVPSTVVLLIFVLGWRSEDVEIAGDLLLMFVFFFPAWLIPILCVIYSRRLLVGAANARNDQGKHYLLLLGLELVALLMLLQPYTFA